ncbi:MAG: GntR family transcriptional regulator [Acidimicrobiia bacterium]
MIIRVNPDDPTPAYEQIRAQITAMAAHGTLRTGARLPTIRQLAIDLGLAKGTVAKAYEELERDRVITTRGRRGSFVQSPTTPPETEVESRLEAAAEGFAVPTVQLGVDENKALKALQDARSRLQPRD